jgi:hypothetical protein
MCYNLIDVQFKNLLQLNNFYLICKVNQKDTIFIAKADNDRFHRILGIQIYFLSFFIIHIYHRNLPV